MTGVDPSLSSVTTARNHARKSGLAIEYPAGIGERLPFAGGSFDAAACTDVLDLVDCASMLIAEISRVLKDGGVFLDDTINRTLRSKVAVIGLFQEWKWTSCAPPNLHDWNKFIRPRELGGMLGKHGLDHRRVVGLQPQIGTIQTTLEMHKRARGKISHGELGRRMQMRASKDISMSYMGWAVKC